MIHTFINDIYTIRQSTDLCFNRTNQNRYTVLIDEADGTHTAYCSSVPVYNARTGQMLDKVFQPGDQEYLFSGSNGNVSVNAETLTMENAAGRISITTPNRGLTTRGNQLLWGGIQIRPTANGIAFQMQSTREGAILYLHTDRPFETILSNTKCFSMMSGDFVPFITASAIGVTDAAGNLCAPATVIYQKLSSRDYTVFIRPKENVGALLLFEVNLYEAKLFQDTTVDSENPGENNAFGSIAFVGDSCAFGQQWLYLRPDISKIPFLADKEIGKIKLYIPQLNCGGRLCLCPTVKRFCSFGSTWETKVDAAEQFVSGEQRKNYAVFDLTRYMVIPGTSTLIQPDGFILRTAQRGSRFAVVSTADSYYAPQILEINYR